MRVGAVVVGFDHWHNDIHRDSTWTREFVHRLHELNPEMKVLVVDNASRIPYSSNTVEILRIGDRVGYGAALNLGLMHLSFQESFDWYITLNNDCQIKPGTKGDVLSVVETLDPNTLYGSGENRDIRLPFIWQWSAWMVISCEIFQAVGFFDEQLSAAFEDFDYQRRAMDLGYQLATAHLPIEHLDMHTRYEDPTYPKRWDECRKRFEAKHGLAMKSWYTDKEISRSVG